MIDCYYNTERRLRIQQRWLIALLLLWVAVGLFAAYRFHQANDSARFWQQKWLNTLVDK